MLLALAGLALFGCAFAPIDSDAGYPSSFPKRAPVAGDCPVFGGSISNRGERHDPASGLVEPAMFGRDVLGLPHLFNDADVLRLTIDESAVPGLFGPMKVHRLHIASDSGTGWVTPAGMSFCKGGELQYVVKEAAGASPIGFGLSSDTIRFVGAADGSVIARRGHQDAGMLFVVPYKFTSATSYYRFPLVPASARRQP